jgi:hypothetical protein
MGVLMVMFQFPSTAIRTSPDDFFAEPKMALEAKAV